ncbi:hypothetical protein GF362_05580 [Candidatus Dojkabacteria bacterium]|nr:hypothetical protein [Candidatus Dojkabacteria bacterium]
MTSLSFIAGMLLILVLIGAGIVAWLFLQEPREANKTSTKTDNSIINETEKNNDFLLKEVNIQSQEDMKNEILSLYINLNQLSLLELLLEESAKKEDSDIFFQSLNIYKDKSEEIFSRLYALEEYEKENELQEYYMPSFSDQYGGAVGELRGSSSLLYQANAKQRHSWLYWVPVIGHFVKSKHQSIETARTNMYDYIKKMPEVDQKAMLKKFHLSNVEDIQEASDSTIENMGRDPELRSSIDWGKISKDVGKAGVNSYVDGIKMTTSGDIPNLAQDTYDNLVKDIQEDGKIDTVGSNSTPKNVSVGMKKDIKSKINKIIPEIEKDINEYSDQDFKDLEDLFDSFPEDDALGVVIDVENSDSNFELEGEWELITASNDSESAIKINAGHDDENSTISVDQILLYIPQILDYHETTANATPTVNPTQTPEIPTELTITYTDGSKNVSGPKDLVQAQYNKDCNLTQEEWDAGYSVFCTSINCVNGVCKYSQNKSEPIPTESLTPTTTPTPTQPPADYNEGDIPWGTKYL